MIKLKRILETANDTEIEKFLIAINDSHPEIVSNFRVSNYLYRAIINSDKSDEIDSNGFVKYDIRRNRNSRDGRDDTNLIAELYRKTFHPDIPSRHEILFCSMNYTDAFKYTKSDENRDVYFIFPDKHCTIYSYKKDSLDGYQSSELQELFDYNLYHDEARTRLLHQMKKLPQYEKIFVFLMDNFEMGRSRNFSSIDYDVEFKSIVDLCRKYITESENDYELAQYFEAVLKGFDSLEANYFSKISAPNHISPFSQEIWVTGGQYYAVNQQWFTGNILYNHESRKLERKPLDF